MIDTQAPPTRSAQRAWWRHRGVLSGLLGTALISLAVLTPGFVPNAILDTIAPLRWLRVPLRFGGGWLAMAAGVTLLYRGWVLLRPAATPGDGPARVGYGRVLALWALPMLVVPPVFSSDVFLYADQAWIIHIGRDPYYAPLARLGGPFAPNVHEVWRGTTAVYPPLALLMQFLVASATQFHAYWSVVAMRIPAIAAVAVLAWAVPRLARAYGADPRVALWVGVLNPLVIIHFIGGAHNDAWMVALVVLAMLAAKRWGWWGAVLGSVLVALGALFKQPGLIAFIAVGLTPVAPRLGRLRLWPRVGTMIAAMAAAGVITAGTFYAVSEATFGFGWRFAADIGELTFGMSPASVVEQIIGPFERLVWDHPLLPVLATAFTVVGALLTAGLAWYFFFSDLVAPGLLRLLPGHGRHSAATDPDFSAQPLRWLVWAFLAVAVSGAGFHTWYLIWGGSMLGVLRYSDRVWRWAVAAAIAGIVVQGGLEYYGLRPIPGWLLGAALGWLFLARTRHLRVRAGRPVPGPDEIRREEPA